MSREAPSTRADFKTWRKLTTRWADNDVYGHVNNTIYYQWFDTAVNGWLLDQGLLDVQRSKSIGLVVETRCSYFSALEFPQAIDVGLAAASIGRSSMRYRIGIFAERAETASAHGEFVHVLVDRSSRRPVDLPDDWRRALETIS